MCNSLVHVFPNDRASEHHMLSVEHTKCISLCLFEPGTRLLENISHCVCGWINSCYISDCDCGKTLKFRKPHPLLMPNFHEIRQQQKKVGSLFG